MSWPPPVPLRSPPGSFRPVHTRPGWLCSDPQLPGSLDLLGRVACHLSCWSGGGGFRTRSGVHLAERKPGPGGRERVPVGSSRFLASPIPPPQQDGLGRRAAWPSVQVSLLPPLSPSGEPCHFSFWGVTQAGLGSGLLGVPRAQLRHPGWGWLPGGPLLSACRPLPTHSHRTPRPAPPELLPRRASLCREAVAVPPYLCPRSGRLLVPRPQSPFDPLLGSEPCDPVGGPRAQAAGAARLSCWVSPRSLCSLQPRSARRGLSGGPAAGQPPLPRAPGLSGNGASPEPPPRPGPATPRPPQPAGQPPWPQERGGGSSVLHAGPDFPPRSRRVRLCVTAEAL